MKYEVFLELQSALLFMGKKKVSGGWNHEIKGRFQFVWLDFSISCLTPFLRGSISVVTHGRCTLMGYIKRS